MRTVVSLATIEDNTRVVVVVVEDAVAADDEPTDTAATDRRCCSDVLLEATESPAPIEPHSLAAEGCGADIPVIKEWCLFAKKWRDRRG